MKGTLSILGVALALGISPGVADAAARPDRSFGDTGWVTTKVSKGGAGLGFGLAVVGKRIVVVGQATKGSPESGNTQAFVARYRQNGRLDKSFGSGGIFETNLPKKQAPFIANAVAPAGSGRLVVAGGYGQGAILAMRLTRAGRLDFWDPIQASGTNAQVLLGTDGSVTGFAHIDYIGGSSSGTPGHGNAGVVQFSSDGQPVSGFGTDGHIEVEYPEPSGGLAGWYPCGGGFDAQGRITIVGGGSLGSKDGVLTARLTPDGTLDPSYGADGDGRAFVAGGRSASETTCGATVAADGTTTVGLGNILAQLTPQGTADPSFGRGGVVNVARPRRVTINAAAPSGKNGLVIAGAAGLSVYVARYLLP